MVVSLLLSLPLCLPSLFSCGAIVMAHKGYSRYGGWGSVERSKGCGHGTHLGHCHHEVGLTIFIWFITLSLGECMISKTMHRLPALTYLILQDVHGFWRGWVRHHKGQVSDDEQREEPMLKFPCWEFQHRHMLLVIRSVTIHS